MSSQYVLDRGSSLRRVSVAKSKSKSHILRRIDWLLILVTISIAAFGDLIIYSVTKPLLIASGLGPTVDLVHQGIYIAIGIVVMAVVMSIDYHKLERFVPLAYFGLVTMLLLVMTPIGSSALGSQRWFSLGPFQLQPSAFTSLVLILVMSSYLAQTQGTIGLKKLISALVMAFIPMILVVIQPDLGTAIIAGFTVLVMLVVGGIKGKHLFALFVLAIVGAYLVITLGLLHHYQLQRLTSFLHNGNQSTTGYNLTQSKITIGSGGLHGKGLFQGPQTNGGYVPAQGTDFIFTAVGEQFGFIGTASLVSGFAILLWRIWSAAMLAKDKLGTLMVAGVFGLIGVSVFQNIGMTIGLMPITGIPLPFLSYGGSAIIAFFAAIGLVLNIRMRRM